MKNKKAILLVIASVLFGSLSSCNKDSSPTNPTSPTETKPVINSFSASPEKITQGTSTTLSWSVSNADKVEIDQGLGIVALSGSTTVKPNTTTTYALTATKGSQTSNKTCQVTVEVPPPVQPVINSFDSSPTTVILESAATLSWNVTDAKKVEIDNGIGEVSAVGSRTVTPSSTTTYTITATNGQYSATKSRTVSVDWRSFVCYRTNTGSKFHRDGCQYLSQSKIQTTLGAACGSGLEPCSVCKPPTCR